MGSDRSGRRIRPAWTHAEDDFLTIQETLLAARGGLASVCGPDAAPVDYFVQPLRIPETVERGWADLPADTRDLCTAYADGLNHHAESHPREALVGLFPVEGKDLVAAFTQKVPLFFGLDAVLGSPHEEEQPDLHAAGAPALLYGSNVLAVSPRRTAGGETLLASNSHQSWTGPVAWYEAHVTSDEGWDMNGALYRRCRSRRRVTTATWPGLSPSTIGTSSTCTNWRSTPTTFQPDGTVTLRSIHQFGSATLDEDSPHHADQAPFVRRETKPVWFDAADTLAHLEREYRPRSTGISGPLGQEWPRCYRPPAPIAPPGTWSSSRTVSSSVPGVSGRLPRS